MNSLCSIYCLAANQSDPDQDPRHAMPCNCRARPSFETFSSVQKKVCEWMLRVWSREAENKARKKRRSTECKRKRKKQFIINRKTRRLFPVCPQNSLSFLLSLGLSIFLWLEATRGIQIFAPGWYAGCVLNGGWVLSFSLKRSLAICDVFGGWVSGDGGEWRICMHSGGVKVVGGVVALSFGELVGRRA